MSTSEKIASVVAQFIAADREEDRKRIAELERDLAALNGKTASWSHSLEEMLALNTRLEEKCAALVLEKELARGELVKLREARDAAPLRIDPDMSDPQPGKLLVVKIDATDVGTMASQSDVVGHYKSQLVGFLVETPAVKQEEQDWVVYDAEEQNRSQRIAGMRVAIEEDDWDWSSIDDARGFKTEAGAHACLRDMGQHWPNRRVITLAEARAIEAKR